MPFALCSGYPIIPELAMVMHCDGLALVGWSDWIQGRICNNFGYRPFTFKVSARQEWNLYCNNLLSGVVAILHGKVWVA